MNNLIELRGNMKSRSNPSKGGGKSLLSNQVVHIADLRKLYNDLLAFKDKWKNVTIIDGLLISVYYSRVVPKSKRISKLFSKGSESSNESIRGIKFDIDKDGKRKHVITHYISREQLDLTINKVKTSIDIFENLFGESVDNLKIEEGKKHKNKIEKYGISYSSFLTTIVDLSNVIKFSTLDNSNDVENRSLITVYETDEDIINILSKIGIEISKSSLLNDNTFYLNEEDTIKLKREAPFLISMSVTDMRELSYEDFDFDYGKPLTIPKPTNEPIVGVIDTLLDKNVYFNEWVTYEDWVKEGIPKDDKSYIHGTAVTSIIVDGPSFNSKLDDGCGRFRVKHFGVAVNGKNSSATIIRNIRDIVSSNKNIKVWNLSLGSILEINPNSISPEAALLDEIQKENNVIFVVAGTNKTSKNPKDYKIGSPADSINSLVVNSVDMLGNIASYSRKGKVLSFFNKPDICYYGGDDNERVRTCIGTGEYLTAGTSFAAPWITRKLAYLIEKLGLTREIAKALIIDSAIGWNKIDEKNCDYMGYGIVPIKIEDIIYTPKDEIRFYIEGIAKEYETYATNIPIPLIKNGYPFIAKATLCYFPKCSRNQGVDYTNTELDIYFGRVRNDNTINSINSNNQTEGPLGYLNEEDAREYYRKWDNVKHIKQEIKSKTQALKSYDNKLWTLSIKAKDRLSSYKDYETKFGVLITIKEINGVNRYDDFVRLCSLNGWIVNEIEVENRLDIYEIANEEITFE